MNEKSNTDTAVTVVILANRRGFVALLLLLIMKGRK